MAEAGKDKPPRFRAKLALMVLRPPIFLWLWFQLRQDLELARGTEGRTDHLRVLIANERKDRLALVAPIVISLGHEVIAREIEVEEASRTILSIAGSGACRSAITGQASEILANTPRLDAPQ
jgi:hypothetical protein